MVLHCLQFIQYDCTVSEIRYVTQFVPVYFRVGFESAVGFWSSEARMRTIWVFVLLMATIAATIAIPMSAAAQNRASSADKQPAKAATSAAAHAAAEAEPASEESSAAKLPVRRVILYKTGVGYFEHLGQVRGDQ
jgi:hypothetical protein